MKYPSNEYALIEKLRRILPRVNDTPYNLTIGDDAAVRENSAGEKLIFTADIFVENVHFTLDTMTFEEVGYKSMAANLSDCASMGAQPESALVQLVFPKNISKEKTEKSIEEIYAGFAKLCEKFNFSIIGGDLSGGAAWTIAITLIGKISPNARALLRTGIKNGNALWVTGMPGMSAAGLACLQRFGRENVPPKYTPFVNAHISPYPRIDEGKTFAENKFVRAAMDLSDGLSKDIATLCYDNNLGFILDCDFPLPPEMKELADELRIDPREWLNHGGEEYELLVACDSSHDLKNCLRLGKFVSNVEGVNILNDSGNPVPLPQKSWDHC